MNFEPIAAPWTDSALCAEVDAELFFPEKGGSTKEAKRVCRACPVRAECLGYALKFPLIKGIWGGLSEEERERLREEPGVSGTNLTPAQAREVAARYEPGRNSADRGNGWLLAAEYGITRAHVLRIAAREQQSRAGNEEAA